MDGTEVYVYDGNSGLIKLKIMETLLFNKIVLFFYSGLSK